MLRSGLSRQSPGQRLEQGLCRVRSIRTRRAVMVNTIRESQMWLALSHFKRRRITAEERDAVIEGWLIINDTHIRRTHDFHLPPTKIYNNRVDDLLMDQILGVSNASDRT